MIGATVGNFEIIAALGKGGMGEVWLAQQKSLRTKVAIKILAAEISSSETHVQRFRNEMIAVSQIPHSGIVKMFDSDKLPDGRAYIVMEYLQGETLANRIKRLGKLELALVADYGRQIASVLDATHGAGITHRDLKPDNIYLVRDAEMVHGERVKILDFGIARLDTTVGPRMTAASVSSIGTPNYMSPEQWHSLAEADWHTDAYALGCVAFEMACGRPPFVAETRVEVCAMHLGEKPPVPSSLVPGLPMAFDNLVSRLLEKEPRDRPTMRDAISVFTALAQGEGVVLSTLPPTGVMSPLAARASSSMQYKMTPRAMPSESGAFAETPIAGSPLGKRTQIAGSSMQDGAIAIDSQLGERDDATPVSSMSLQFKPTPVSGFESQTGMRAQTEPSPAGDQRASQPMLGASQQMLLSATRPRRWPLVVGLLAAVAAGVIVAVVLAGGSSSEPDPNPGTESGTGLGTGSSVPVGSAPKVGPGSGSAKVATGSGSATPGSAPAPAGRAIVELPPLKHAVMMPKVASATELRVCIDAAGSVDSVELKVPGALDKRIESIVSSWEYQPYGKPPEPACGYVTIAAESRKPVAIKEALPERLSPKMITDAIGRVQDNVMDCDKGDLVATFDVALVIGKDGIVKSIALTPKPPAGNPLAACLTKAFKAARFAATQTDHTIHQTLQFGR